MSITNDQMANDESKTFHMANEMKANEKYLQDFFLIHQKTILENTIQEYRLMFIYDNIPLLLGYVCLFVLGIVANAVQIYATVLQIRRRENLVCSKMFLQLAISQTLLILYLIPMDYLWRYSQVWEAGENACKILVWIRFYLIVTVAAFTVLQTFVRYRVMRASAEAIESGRKYDIKTVDAKTSMNDSESCIKLLPNTSERDCEKTTGSDLNDVRGDQPKSWFGRFKPLSQSFTRSVIWPIQIYIFGLFQKTKRADSGIESTGTTFQSRHEFTSRLRENRLIVLGWVLPFILCAPEAAVYKLHVHKEIGGYQQCADIFVKQEELLFPRLYSNDESGNDAPLKSQQLDSKEDNSESREDLSSFYSNFDGEQTTSDNLIANPIPVPTVSSHFWNGVDLETIESVAMTPVQIVYYLLLQSLTFVIPVGAIIILNILVIRCYIKIRLSCKPIEEKKITSNTKTSDIEARRETQSHGMTLKLSGISTINIQTEMQIRALRSWAASRTLFLTLSFGISYIICWLPMAILMASRWNTLFTKPTSDFTTVLEENHVMNPESGGYLHIPIDDSGVEIGTEEIVQYSFWSFMEEWAIAFGLLIGIVNPLLYGFFHLMGGNKQKLYDFQSEKSQPSSSQPDTDGSKKSHLQHLFSRSQTLAANNPNQMRHRHSHRQQSFKKLSTASRNLVSRYSNYSNGRLPQKRTSSSHPSEDSEIAKLN